MTFTSRDIVFVTGANGHIAQHVANQLLALDNGPMVRASVRSEASIKQLQDHWPTHVKSGRLEVVRLLNLLDPDAFTTLLNGVTHVAHLASPLSFDVKNVEEDMLKPAVQGTKGVLAAAAKVSSIKCVVVTGSFVAVADTAYGLRPGYEYTTKDWNPISYKDAADPNLDLTQWPEKYRQYITYMASKALAERALWDFYDKQKPAYALNVVLPTWVGGPYVLPLPDGSKKLSASIGLLFSCATGGEVPPVDFPNWIDVRDVAKAHIKALEHTELSHVRILIGGGPLHYDHIAEIAKKRIPGVTPSTTRHNFPKSEHFSVDNSSIGLIGMKVEDLIPAETMVVDTVQCILENEAKSN